VPHAVVIEDSVSQVDLQSLGSYIRNHSLFSPAGTNVNFVQVDESDTLTIRTYERGVEDETLACGTGMVASALIYHQLNGIEPPVNVNVKGGDTLVVSWDYIENRYSNVTLTGPAITVFKGKIYV
jgi:diaminopimelate epimerase